MQPLLLEPDGGPRLGGPEAERPPHGETLDLISGLDADEELALLYHHAPYLGDWRGGLRASVTCPCIPVRVHVCMVPSKAGLLCPTVPSGLGAEECGLLGPGSWVRRRRHLSGIESGSRRLRPCLLPSGCVHGPCSQWSACPSSFALFCDLIGVKGGFKFLSARNSEAIANPLRASLPDQRVAAFCTLTDMQRAQGLEDGPELPLCMEPGGQEFLDATGYVSPRPHCPSPVTRGPITRTPCQGATLPLTPRAAGALPRVLSLVP